MQALDNEFGPRRRELMTMQNDLKAKAEKFDKEGAVMSEADRANEEKKQRDQQREFQRKAGEFQDDASTRKNEELGKVQRYLVQEIQTYANAQGFDLVLGQGVFFAKPALDITANVLAVLKASRQTQRAHRRAGPGQDPHRQSRNSALILSHGMCVSAGGIQPGGIGGAVRPGARGDPDIRVSHVATLSQAGPGSVSFLGESRLPKEPADDPRERSGADGGRCQGCPVAALIGPNPYLSYARIANCCTRSPGPPGSACDGGGVPGRPRGRLGDRRGAGGNRG